MSVGADAERPRRKAPAALSVAGPHNPPQNIHDLAGRGVAFRRHDEPHSPLVSSFQPVELGDSGALPHEVKHAQPHRGETTSESPAMIHIIDAVARVLRSDERYIVSMWRRIDEVHCHRAAAPVGLNHPVNRTLGRQEYVVPQIDLLGFGGWRGTRPGAPIRMEPHGYRQDEEQTQQRQPGAIRRAQAGRGTGHDVLSIWITIGTTEAATEASATTTEPVSSCQKW